MPLGFDTPLRGTQPAGLTTPPLFGGAMTDVVEPLLPEIVQNQDKSQLPKLGENATLGKV